MHPLRALLRTAHLHDGFPTSVTRQPLFGAQEGAWLGRILGHGLTTESTPSPPLESAPPSPPMTNPSPASDAPQKPVRRVWQKRKNGKDYTIANLELLSRWGMSAENQLRMKDKSARLPTLSTDHLQGKLKWMVAELGFTEAEVVRVLQSSPNFLNHSVGGKLAPLKSIFLDTGFNNQDVKGMILRHPRVPRDANKIHLMCDFLETELQLPKTDTLAMLVKHPRLLTYSIAGNIGMTIGRFKTLGLSSEEIGSIFLRTPGLIGRDFAKVIKSKLTWLEAEFGLDAEGAVERFKADPQPFVASLDTWKKNVEYFVSMGLAKDTIAKEWLCLFGWRTDGMEEMKKFAMETLKKSEEEILEYPTYFKTPFARVILFRVAFLGSKGEDFTKVSLQDLCGSVPKEFFEKFSMTDVDAFEEKWLPMERDRKIELVRTGTFSP
ncbi:hypothetical protein BSKO_12391 [Bryopsis sp. KO-2023]|nr:hypothetical protein BSKO_12391 [Bryopsis sp. KO-2023]